MNALSGIDERKGKCRIPGGFLKGFNSIPYSSLTDIEIEIRKLCYWSFSTFNSRLRGKSPFRIYEAKQIEKYFEEKGFNAWTGEPIDK